MLEAELPKPLFALRPIVERPGDSNASAPLAGGPLRFSRFEAIARSSAGEIHRAFAAIDGCAPAVAVAERAGLAPDRVAAALESASARPAPVAGLAFDQPRIMAVLNVTPDSFSDGGVHFAPDRAVEAALEMIDAGADMIDVGAESTRPGADDVDPTEEWDRLAPVLEGLRAAGVSTPISIDTRKVSVARAAFAAGARLWNDVSALRFEPDALAAAAEATRRVAGSGVCLMHAQGAPKTMQTNPTYADALLDVLGFIDARVAAFAGAGGRPEDVLIDPGIGFGKTLEHNLTLLRGLSAFVATGRPVLVGVSRKRMIGTLSGQQDAARRGPGSVGAAIAALAQGARVLRMHDVEMAVQAVRVWREVVEGDAPRGSV